MVLPNHPQIMQMAPQQQVIGFQKFSNPTALNGKWPLISLNLFLVHHKRQLSLKQQQQQNY